MGGGKVNRQELRPQNQSKLILNKEAGKPGANETHRREKKCGSGLSAQKYKSSEVVLGPFVSASSSLLDPCSTCYAASLAGALHAIFARAPGSPPTGKTYPTPRNSILPSTFLLVLLDQRFAIDPCLPSLFIFMKRVTTLESRTPHQPEKL